MPLVSPADPSSPFFTGRGDPDLSAEASAKAEGVEGAGEQRAAASPSLQHLFIHKPSPAAVQPATESSERPCFSYFSLKNSAILSRTIDSRVNSSPTST